MNVFALVGRDEVGHCYDFGIVFVGFGFLGVEGVDGGFH